MRNKKTTTLGYGGLIVAAAGIAGKLLSGEGLTGEDGLVIASVIGLAVNSIGNIFSQDGGH